MDNNHHFLIWLARERLAEARGWAAQTRLADRAPRRPLRRAAGIALVRLGQRLLATPPGAPPLGAPDTTLRPL
jgi:hypothetical protein